MNSYYDKEGNRKIPFKKDETRGNSQIDPLNYKGDVLAQTWIDSRVLATLSVWLEKNGYFPKSLSDIVRTPLEMLMEFLVNNKDVEVVEDTNNAREILQNRYRVMLNKGGRGGKNILHNQVLSERRHELGESIRRQEVVSDANKPIEEKKKVVSDEKMKELLDIYYKIDRNDVKVVENDKREEIKVVTRDDIEANDDLIKSLLGK